MGKRKKIYCGGIKDMINIDMWYGDDHKKADKSTLLFVTLIVSTEGIFT